MEKGIQVARLEFNKVRGKYHMGLPMMVIVSRLKGDRCYC